MANPNTSRIILISIDNLRSDCISANPDKSALGQYTLGHFPVTPTLDRLAAAGTTFWRCFSAAPYTTASHASILTGLYPSRHGIQEYYRHALAKDAKTLFEIFKNAGYTTLLATDFPFLIGPNLDFTRSVDHYITENDAQVFQTLATYQEEPFFAFIHFGSIHNPFGLTSLQIDGDFFVQQVQELGEKMGVPEQFELEQEWIERPRVTRERLLRQRYFKSTDLLYQQGRYDQLMNLFVKGVEYFDSTRFQTFMETLERMGLTDNAILAIVADHGEEYSERAFAHYNGLWEGIVNVPLILHGQSIPRGKSSRSVCRTVDIAPTLLDLAGITNPNAQPFDGTSLRSHIQYDQAIDLNARGETWYGRTKQILDFMALCQTSNRLLKTKTMANTRVEYLRTAQWKFILRTDMENHQEECWLFEIEKDRVEENNLADQMPELVTSLKSEIAAGRTRGAGQVLQIEEEQLAELALNLKDWGYLDGRSSS